LDKFARTVVPIEIEQEMRNSYLDYSMSVIIGRALPDVRDGLKPVHRRILYAMLRNGLHWNRPYRKCANVVGEVLGKLHPHGDVAVYDALVRMAQPWNLRYLLVDGQGNFGSVDGDAPAAYRYTECRMTQIAEELLLDIDSETVDFIPNFDGKGEEPVVLPAAFPNLLVNGAEGIAVGMATKIPPHNLGEVISGLLALIDDPLIDISALMAHVPAPDFPTGGVICGLAGVREAYETGRGRVIVRGVTEEEELDGRDAIIITELPYQVNKARFQEEIAELVKDKKLEGIHALRDESDRHGMRVVIELKRDAVREIVLAHLHKHTQLQATFGVIFLSIVHQRPRVLNLKEMLQYYLAHRREVTLRRLRYELRKAQERAHVLEGLRIALDHIDAIIALIRASQTTDEARQGLVGSFGLSLVQADAILEMRLARLVGLERARIEAEYAELVARIAWLEATLASEARLMAVVREELAKIGEKYGDARRTRISNEGIDADPYALVEEEDQVLTFSHRGYIKRTPVDEYRAQRRGGMGKTGMSTREEDFVRDLFIANTHGQLLVFTNQGRMYLLPVVEVPEATAAARGKPLVNLLTLADGETVASVVPVRGFEDGGDLIFVSRRGLIKRTELADYRNVRSSGIMAVDVVEGDELLRVIAARRENELLLTTRMGMSIRFAGEEVRPMGRVARGVRAIDLEEGDALVDVAVLPQGAAGHLLTITAKGYGKRTDLAEYRLQGRAGKGVIDIQTEERNGAVVGAVVVNEGDQVILVTDSGRVIRIRTDEIREVGRNTKGVRLMRLEDDEVLVSMARLEDAGDPGEGAETPPEGGPA
jgi:DNA gyrase subunit A